MVKYFMSRLMYFQEPEAVKIQPESEISCHNTDKCNKWFIPH